MFKSGKKTSATTLLCELSKLKAQQKYLEASQIVLNPANVTATRMTELNELDNLKIEQELNWPTYKQKLKYDVQYIRELIKEFRNEMMSVDSLPKFNTKQYREKIQLIDQKLRDVEANNVAEMKQMKLAYCHIESELLPLLHAMNFMQTAASASATGGKLISSVAAMNIQRATSAPIDKSDCGDVRKFDRYLKDFRGHTGGWINEEHLLFVKMKNKYKTDLEQICFALKVLFIDKSDDDIRAHNEWYEKYMELKSKKKVAIENWKKSRLLRHNLHSA